MKRFGPVITGGMMLTGIGLLIAIASLMTSSHTGQFDESPEKDTLQGDPNWLSRPQRRTSGGVR